LLTFDITFKSISVYGPLLDFGKFWKKKNVSWIQTNHVSFWMSNRV